VAITHTIIFGKSKKIKILTQKMIMGISYWSQYGSNHLCRLGKLDIMVLQFGPFYPMWNTASGNADYFTIYTRNNADNTDGYWQLALVQEGSNEIAWMTNTSYDIVGLFHYDEVNGYL